MRAGASEIGCHLPGAIMAQAWNITIDTFRILPAEAARLEHQICAYRHSPATDSSRARGKSRTLTSTTSPVHFGHGVSAPCGAHSECGYAFVQRKIYKFMKALS